MASHRAADQANRFRTGKKKNDKGMGYDLNRGPSCERGALCFVYAPRSSGGQADVCARCSVRLCTGSRHLPRPRSQLHVLAERPVTPPRRMTTRRLKRSRSPAEASQESVTTTTHRCQSHGSPSALLRVSVGAGRAKDPRRCRIVELPKRARTGGQWTFRAGLDAQKISSASSPSVSR